MEKNAKKIRAEACFVALFLVGVLIFSSFRAKIADYAAWLLAMTHEISLSPAQASQAEAQGQTQAQARETQAPIKFSALAQAPAPKNKIVERINPTANKKTDAPDKPVTVNLPKTETPVIAFTNDITDWSRSGAVLFPPLRKFDGTVWDKEKTEIKIATDGKKLYVLCRAYDKNPEGVVTVDAQKRKGKGIWDTDSIELFLMKNGKSDHYCQYIISVNSQGQTFYNKTAGKPNDGQIVTPPESFEFPRFNVEEFDGGFEFEIRIALSNINVNTLGPGDFLLMQIVRNYRGQSEKESVALQLFPVYIYAESRFGLNNRDIRAFQAIPVKRDK
jgi:hypothetical protein